MIWILLVDCGFFTYTSIHPDLGSCEEELLQINMPDYCEVSCE